MYFGLSLIGVLPISQCFLLEFPCSFSVISRVASFIMLFSWILSFSIFTLIREVLEGFWVSFFLSFDFILDSRNTSSLFTFDADCLSTDRSHIHCQVEVIFESFAQTFNGNRAIPISRLLAHTFVEDHVMPFSGELEEVLMKLVEPILSFGLMSMRLVCLEPAIGFIPFPQKKSKSCALRLSREEATCRSRPGASTIAP